jgi:effector-binding domain-containing protein
MGKAKWIAAAAAAVLIGGAGAAYAQYRDIEQPAYTSLSSEDAFELREYPELLVAEVTHEGPRGRALSAGFRRLAAYIFAEDRPGAPDQANSDQANSEESEPIAMTSPVLLDQSEAIAMTSPVMQDAEAEGVWRTRFVMPSKYTLETLPQAPKDISLTVMPARQMAAVRFSGRGSSADLALAEDALRSWMAARDLIAGGPAEYAFYDAPMVPPPLRRNEVMIPVAAKQ